VEVLTNHEPLSGAVDEMNVVWLASRQNGTCSRSSVMFHKLEFDDANGCKQANLCWMAPVSLNGETHEFTSMEHVLAYSKQFVLILLPLLGNEGTFLNYYYLIVHECWTERNSIGIFERSTYVNDIFKDWITSTSKYRVR
jgi:hypothetical protein